LIIGEQAGIEEDAFMLKDGFSFDLIGSQAESLKKGFAKIEKLPKRFLPKFIFKRDTGENIKLAAALYQPIVAGFIDKKKLDFASQ